MRIQRATVFGGSGFVGRRIVKRLAADGVVVRVAVRDPESALSLKPMGAVGQIVPAYADVTNEESVRAAILGADVVVNTVGMYVPRGKGGFDAVHVEGARNVATQCAAQGVKRLVHMSGLGADAESPNAYVRSRGKGDHAVRTAFPEAAILRPSAMFGPGDALFSTIGNMTRFAPMIPVFGGGRAKVQPVYVADVADAAMACIRNRETQGTIYELGGPRAYQYRDLMRMAVAATGRGTPVVAIPFWVGYLMAFFSRPLPNPPLTRDMLYMMSVDNVVSGDQPGLADLGVEPHTVESILPSYMDAFRRGGRWKSPRLA